MSAKGGENIRDMIPPDFTSIKDVPDSFAWLKSDTATSLSEAEAVPVVDLKNPEVAKMIGHACETWGMVHVINHGIPSELLAEVDSEARKLFRLPQEEKLKVIKDNHGSTGYGVSRVSQSFDKKVWFEGFTIRSLPALYDQAKVLFPSDYHHFCEVMEEADGKMKELVGTLLSLFLNFLDVTDEELGATLAPGENCLAALQLNSYPPCPNPDRAMGLAPHTDTSLFTIVRQDSNSVLQVLKEGLGWVEVKPVASALSVNIGDFMHVLSNARFNRVAHRIELKEPKHRISIAYFYTMKEDFMFYPLSLRDGEAPVYRPLKSKEFVEVKLGGKDPKKEFCVTKNEEDM